MGGNKIVYKEAFDQAKSGKTRSIWQRLMFRFQDHYTQTSREQGEHDGAAAREYAASMAGSSPTGGAGS
ncbi:MAG TPA: hypothetical protein VF006_04220 [Longimicrobium sp.]